MSAKKIATTPDVFQYRRKIIEGQPDTPGTWKTIDGNYWTYINERIEAGAALEARALMIIPTKKRATKSK